MNPLWLLVFSLVPGVGLFAFFYSKDTEEREPLPWIMAGFFIGLLLITPAILIERLIETPFSSIADLSFGELFTDAFVRVALVEELLKFLVVVFWASRLKWFDEVYDGVLYAVTISLGFATLENVLYVVTRGVEVGIVRAILTVPMHALTAVVMGVFVSYWKFGFLKTKWFALLIGISLATFFHGLFNYFILLSNRLFFFGALLIVVFLAWITHRIFIRIPSQELALTHARQRKEYLSMPHVVTNPLQRSLRDDLLDYSRSRVIRALATLFLLALIGIVILLTFFAQFPPQYFGESFDFVTSFLMNFDFLM